MKKNKYLIPIIISATFVIGLVLRILLFREVSWDYYAFLSRWIAAFAQNGLSAAASIQSDYNAPYLVVCYLASLCKGWEMIFIKLVSTLFDVFLCVGVFFLVKKLSNTTKAVITSCIIWLLPTVILNSAWWSQCDSIYVSLCVWSLYLLLCEKRAWLSAFLAGVAFAFKIQTIFYLGVGVIALEIGKLKLKHLLTFVGGFLAACLPGVLLGYPVTRIFTVYGMQIGNPSYLKRMSLNSASVWSILTLENISFIAIPIAVAATLAIILYGMYRNNVQKKTISLFDYALLLSCVIPFLLPHMHDRYFYMFEIFAVVAAVLYKKYSIAILAQAAGIIVYQNYMGAINEKWLRWIPLATDSAAAGCLMAVAVAITAFYCLRKNSGHERLYVT